MQFFQYLLCFQWNTRRIPFLQIIWIYLLIFIVVYELFQVENTLDLLLRLMHAQVEMNNDIIKLALMVTLLWCPNPISLRLTEDLFYTDAECGKFILWPGIFVTESCWLPPNTTLTHSALQFTISCILMWNLKSYVLIT